MGVMYETWYSQRYEVWSPCTSANTLHFKNKVTVGYCFFDGVGEAGWIRESMITATHTYTTLLSNTWAMLHFFLCSANMATNPKEMSKEKYTFTIMQESSVNISHWPPKSRRWWIWIIRFHKVLIALLWLNASPNIWKLGEWAHDKWEKQFLGSKWGYFLNLWIL